MTFDFNKINANMSEFFKAYNQIDEQVWSLPHEVINSTEFSRFLYFAPEQSNEQAIILNPPRAGHHSNIGQPLVKLFLSMGFEVYAIDHLPATQETKHYGLTDIYNEMDIAFGNAYFSEIYYSKIHLVGLCQGGWAIAIWAALNPYADYSSLTIAGSPIDFQIDGGKIQTWLAATPDCYFENVIRCHDGIWPGEKQLLGFKALNPVDRHFGTYCDLNKAILANDKDEIKKWVRNNSWYETAHDLPGEMIRQVITDLFRGNKLINDRLFIYNTLVDLSKISCPVAAITGADDDITLERQCTAIHTRVSSTTKIHRHIPDCGHIAIYLKREALDVWQEVIGQLM